MNLRLSNGIDWAHEFTAHTPEQLEAGCAKSFRAYIAEKHVQFFEFSKWLNEQIAELEDWKNKHEDTPANNGQYTAWLHNAQQGKKYGRQIITPVKNPNDMWLELHVENPVIRGEWCNPTPWVSNSPAGAAICPTINKNLEINTHKKDANFAALFVACKNMEEHARNLSMLGKWVVGAVRETGELNPKQPRNLRLVSNDEDTE